MQAPDEPTSVGQFNPVVERRDLAELQDQGVRKPMLLIVQNLSGAAVTFGIFAFSLLGMYLFWYRKLPPENPSEASLAQDQSGSP